MKRAVRPVRSILTAWLLIALAGQALAQAAPASPQASPPESRLFQVPANASTVARLAAHLPRMTPATVTRIVDGDTIVVSFDPALGLGRTEKVRLIGVDTPETVDPRKPVERFGREAAAFASDALLGKTVRLAFEFPARDYFDRLLAYVFLEDGACFNLEIVARGYGFAYTKYPFRFMDEFRAAERSARLRKRGLCGDAVYSNARRFRGATRAGAASQG